MRAAFGTVLLMSSAFARRVASSAQSSGTVQVCANLNRLTGDLGTIVG